MLAYRGDRPQPNIHDHTVILVDDGIATGSTISRLDSVKALVKYYIGNDS